MTSQARGIRSAIDEGRQVARTLNPATVLVLLAFFVVLHAISWILLPFVPLVNRLARSLRLPRTLVAVAIFAILVAAAAGVAALGISPLTGGCRSSSATSGVPSRTSLAC